MPIGKFFELGTLCLLIVFRIELRCKITAFVMIRADEIPYITPLQTCKRILSQTTLIEVMTFPSSVKGNM